jgi:hypothetical protein
MSTYRVRHSAVAGLWTVDRRDPDHHGAHLEGWRAVRSFPTWEQAWTAAVAGV